MSAIEKALKRELGSQADCAIEKCIRCEMNVSAWKPGQGPA
jgi:hypothetical protein